MIDFHNHILPNIDDGSESLEMSLSMLEYASKQGITEVVNTVHYQHPKVMEKDISYIRIQQETQNLQMELDKNFIPIKIHIGAEVFFFPNLVKIKDNPLVTIGKGKYMLVEFHPYHLPDIHKEVFFDLKMLGVTPIIAHPERYKAVQNDVNIVLEWINAGCLIQVDAGSVLGSLGKSAQEVSEKIIKRNWCQILGSDAHDTKRRNFNLKDAFTLVKNWVGENAESLVYDNPKAVINGDAIKLDLIDDNIEKESSFWNKYVLKKKT